MRVQVIPVIREAREEDFARKTAVVIDTLRATSNMAAALASGASSVLAFETVEEALAARRDGDLLGGERECQLIPGFDISNSPFEYVSERVRGRRIVMTTTNGTRAFKKTGRALAAMACSLLNARASARAAAAFGTDVAVLCSGTKDAFNVEDGLTAGLFLEELLDGADGRPHNSALEICDFGKAMLGYYRSVRCNVEREMADGDTGRRLASLGFGRDVAFCAQTNGYDVVPLLRQGVLIPYVPESLALGRR